MTNTVPPPASRADRLPALRNWIEEIEYRHIDFELKHWRGPRRDPRT
jgi:hypothetical protein